MSENLKVPTRLVLVRHGQSLHNASLRCEDGDEILDQVSHIIQTSENPDLEYSLTVTGEKQVELAREMILNDKYSTEILSNGERYHSHFMRAIQTARILSDGDLSGWKEEELIGEREYGLFGSSVRGRDKGQREELLNEYFKDDYWGTDFGGEGESINSVSERAHNFISRCIGEEAVLLSTHGDFIRALRHVVEGEDISRLTPKSEEFPIWNAMILEYEKVGDKLYRRYRYPDTNGKPLPDGTGKWLKNEH